MFNKNLYNTQYHNENLSNYSFLITGGAGFIGSNLVEYLLKYNAGHVRVLDNLSNGYFDNIKQFTNLSNFEFIEGDIRDIETCNVAVKKIDFISHQAALGSVPRSVANPILTNEVNVGGFLNMLYAAKESKSLKRFVYAASSSTYGNSPLLPKVEGNEGRPLSPYAITKLVNELYGDVFSKVYAFHTIGLRYFNVFGPKQSPDNPYASVIPLFIKCALNKKSPIIYGDGLTSRDFTFIENVVQANINSIFAPINSNLISNVAFGENLTLNDLWVLISKSFNCEGLSPIYEDERIGDIKHSLASLDIAKKYLNYNPLFSVKDGIELMKEIISKNLDKI